MPQNNLKMFCGMASKDNLNPDIYMIQGPTLKPFDVISSLREKKQQEGYKSKPFFEVLDNIFMKEMVKANVEEDNRINHLKVILHSFDLI